MGCLNQLIHSGLAGCPEEGTSRGGGGGGGGDGLREAVITQQTGCNSEVAWL